MLPVRVIPVWIMPIIDLLELEDLSSIGDAGVEKIFRSI